VTLKLQENAIVTENVLHRALDTGTAKARSTAGMSFPWSAWFAYQNERQSLWFSEPLDR